MSRSGYTDDCEDQWSHIMWRGAVASAIRGKRGQAFLREFRSALDGMAEKRLEKEVLAETTEIAAVDGELPVPVVHACALGVVARARGIDTAKIDIYDHDSIHSHFDISNALAREILWENDESYPYPKTPEERWRKMRWWVERQLFRQRAGT